MGNTEKTGVQPGYETTLEVCTSGRPADLKGGTYAPIKDLLGCSVSINGSTETWNPMDAGGWERNAINGKGITISCTAKRNYGDAGNDYIAGLTLASGDGVQSAAKITWPNKQILYIPCIIDVKTVGGESTALNQLTFDIKSDGKPEKGTVV